ncbi:MAG: FAD-dependent oxidoreductase [Candidatus Thermoplasmatota archaeon]|mgnify:CR=1 FL=1
MADTADRDVAIVGGGILGTCVAYWLAARYDGRIVVLERERDVALHTSRRNTGVVHRPFYLHPQKAKRFARAAQVSYGLWRSYAAAKGLPWREVGTHKVAGDETGVRLLETYAKWAVENGMDASEVELLDGREVFRREPNIACAGSLLVHTDTVVDYAAFTRALRADAEALGARFLTSSAVERITANDGGVTIGFGGSRPDLRARFLVNCAGGESLDIAHMMGVGTEFADLHFRGDYWIVDQRVARLVRRNVYPVPRQPDLPFLDPHWIVRPDDTREIGPNAGPVPTPYAYEGMVEHLPRWVEKFFEPPVANKLLLAFNRDFLTLAAREALSSLSRADMLERVRRFIPALREEHLTAPGFAGIRSSAINRQGAIVKEAIELPGPHSYHVVNYNSPGATGAPAIAAYLVDRLAARGDLDHLTPNPKKAAWDWDAVAKAMEFVA